MGRCYVTLAKASQSLAKREIDPAPSGQRIFTFGERRHPVKREARRSAPYGDIATLDPDAAWPLAPAGAAEKKYCG